MGAGGRAGAAGGHGCGRKDGKGGRWMGGKSSWQAAGQVGRGEWQYVLRVDLDGNLGCETITL